MKHYTKFSFAAAVLAASVAFTACKSTKKGSKPAGPVSGIEKPKSDIKSITEATKKNRKISGLFTFYQDSAGGAVQMLVSADQLEKEYIYFSQSMDGLAGLGLNRGTYRGSKIFFMRKYFNRIEFVTRNNSFYFDPNNALSKASKANIAESVIFSAPLSAQDEAKKLYLIKADDLFFSESFSQLKPQMMGAMAGMVFNLGMMSKDKSKFASIKSYPKNTDILVDYHFDNPAPGFMGADPGLTDPRYVTIKVQHSFIEVPKNNFKPRYDDPRVGYFMTNVTEQTSMSATPYRDMIHRWNLEKKDKGAAMSEPVEPITWWIENTTPVELRPLIKKAGEAWNEAFEKIGFKNAVVVKEQSDTATWDAGDIRYNVLRWTASPAPPFGGYGPSFVNPLTGQILGADIMLEYTFLTNRLNIERLYSNRGAEAEIEMHRHLEFKPEHDPKLCAAAMGLQVGNMFGAEVLKAAGTSAVDMRRMTEESIYYLILHEMGHTFGLNHNMKATQMLKPDELNDLNKTKALGLMGSVMDYPAINISPDPAKQGQYYSTKPGPYDMWAIEYGYSVGLEDEAAEKERLKKILDRSTDPLLTFGNDADDMRSPGKGMDPRVNIFDHSSDAITYGTERIKLGKKVMATLKDKYTPEGQSYQGLLQAYNVLCTEMGNQSGAISRYIGGVYVDRAMVGQRGGTRPYTPVALADQKRAMKALTDNVFAPNALEGPKELYAHLSPQRRGFNLYSGEDPKVTDRLFVIQLNALSHITHPATLRRITDSESYGNEYKLADMMNDLTDAIFKADYSANVTTLRQKLQAFYVNELIFAAGLDKRAGVAAPVHHLAKAAAYRQLTKIKRMSNAAGDESSKAHKEFITATIDKALRAD